MVLRDPVFRLSVPSGDPDRTTCPWCAAPLRHRLAVRCGHCRTGLGTVGALELSSAAVLGLLLGRFAGQPAAVAFGFLGALGIAVANRVYMLEHSIYAVISPEGCASILWRSSDKAQDAAAAMRITAQDLLELKLIDGIVAEPPGGAHRDPEEAIQAVGETIARALSEMLPLSRDDVKRQRREKYLAMGRNLGA